MAPRLVMEQLQVEHLPDLADVLRKPEVYEHIGDVPSLRDFILDRERALLGPGQGASAERWLNFLVREASSNLMLGRMEATLHDAIAEVAFLFGPQHWGKGYAIEALTWLHAEVRGTYGVTEFWATTIPANTRCQSLLRRSGYLPVTSHLPLLYSFDHGDLAYKLRDAA